MPGFSFTAGRMLSVDTHLAANTSTKVPDLTTTNFFVGGIHVNSSSDEDEEAAGYCTVVGKLKGDGDNIVTLKVATKQPVPAAFAEIVKEGTTGVGIFFVAE